MRQRTILRWSDTIVPVILLLMAVYWLAFVSIPFYVFGISRLTLEQYVGDSAVYRFSYCHLMGPILTTVTLALWCGFYSVVGILALVGITISSLLRSRRFLTVLALVVAAAMYLHLVSGLWWAGWPNRDVQWALEAINHNNWPK